MDISWTKIRRWARFSLVCAVLGANGRILYAQALNQVFVRDSLAAAEATERALELAETADLRRAVEAVQEVLEVWGEALVSVEGDGDGAGYATVRDVVHREVLGRERLLEGYVAAQSGAAGRLLELGFAEEVWRDRWLTGEGFDAGLALAQEDLIGGRRWSAWLRLVDLWGHPSAGGERAERLRALGASVLVTMDAEEAERALARGWGDALDAGEVAGGGLPGDGVVRPEVAGPAIELGAIVPTPILSREVGGDGEGFGMSELGGGDGSLELALMTPVVREGVVYTATSSEAVAWDAATLRVLWRTRLAPAVTSEAGRDGRMQSRGGRGGVVRPGGTEPAVSWPFVVTATGVANVSASDRRLVCLDARDGGVVWQLHVDDVDVGFTGDVVLPRPPLIVEGMALLLVHDSDQQARGLVSRVLAFDVADGDLLWARSLATVSQGQRRGSMSWAAGLAARDGLVYVNDGVGSVSAMRARTGELEWINLLESVASPFGRGVSQGANDPVLIDDLVVVLTPNDGLIVALDAATGMRIPELPQRSGDRVLSLMGVGDVLYALTRESVVAGPARAFFERKALSRHGFGRPSSVAVRASISGDRLLVPRTGGVDVLAFHKGQMVVGQVELDRPGLVMAAEDALLSVQGERLYVYTSWAMAERVLGERLRAEPDDPWAAVTLAEAAGRTQRTDALMPAVDAAIASIERDPAGEQQEAARAALFELLLRFAVPTTDPVTNRGGVLDLQTRVGLAARLASLESSFADRASRLLAAGQLALEGRNPGWAVEHYQRVLVDDAIADANARVPAAGVVLARAEARFRLERLVDEFGFEVYRQWDAQARDELALLTDGGRAKPDDLLSLAERYPLASASARARVLAADGLRARGRYDMARHALERVLAMPSERRLGMRDGEVLGRLVRNFAEAGQPLAAEARLRRMMRLGIALTIDGVALDLDGLGIGVEGGGRAGFAGYGVPTDLVFSNAAWLPAEVEARWDAPAALVYLETGQGALVEARAEEVGVVGMLPVAAQAVRWLAGGAGPLIQDGQAGEYGLFDVENGGVRWRVDVEQYMGGGDERARGRYSIVDDGEAVVFVRSDGAAVGVRVDDGEVVWARRLSVSTVPMVEGFGQTVVVCGGTGGERSRPTRVVAFELATGRVFSTRDFSEEVREIAVSPEALVVVRGRQMLSVLDVHAGLQVAGVEPRLIVNAQSMEAVAGRILVADRTVGLRRGSYLAIDTLTGESLGPISLPGELMTRNAFGIRIHDVGDRFAFSSNRGVAVIRRTGGISALYAPGSLVHPPVCSRGYVYVLHFTPTGPVEAGARRGNAYRLATLELETGRLVSELELGLDAAPVSMSMVRGGLMIVAGTRTVFVPLPEDAP